MRAGLSLKVVATIVPLVFAPLAVLAGGAVLLTLGTAWLSRGLGALTAQLPL